MNTAFFILAILGCGDDNGGCRQVRVVDTAYASQEACSTATSAALLRNSDLDYPVISAECRATTKAQAQVELARFPKAA